MKTPAQHMPDQVLKGVLYILVGVTALSFSDAMIKFLNGDYPMWQILTLRSAFALPMLIAGGWLMRWRYAAALDPWVTLRSWLLILAWLAYFASLVELSLSTAAVVVYSNPIITALLSAVFLAARVSARQWVGVFLGFAGVVVILQPGSDAFSWYVALPLVTAVFYSIAMIITRTRCRSIPAYAMVMSLHLNFVTLGLAAMALLAVLSLTPKQISANPFLLGIWVAMPAWGWGLMLVLAVVAICFAVSLALAYQNAPPQIIATFDYSYLIAAVIWGVVFFAEWPDRATFSGMFLISLAGILVVWGQRRPQVLSPHTTG